MFKKGQILLCCTNVQLFNRKSIGVCGLLWNVYQQYTGWLRKNATLLYCCCYIRFLVISGLKDKDIIYRAGTNKISCYKRVLLSDVRPESVRSVTLVPYRCRRDPVWFFFQTGDPMETIQSGPERMQQLRSLISRTSSIKRNWFLFHYVENSFPNKMTPWSLILGKVS